MIKTKRQIAQEKKRCFWQKHIQDWEESGITQTDYCHKYGLKRDQFTYWKGKLAQDTSGVSLVPVPVRVNLQPSTNPLVLVVDSRFRIEVGGDFESATLGKLVNTLRHL